MVTREKRTQHDYTLAFKLAVVDEVEKGELTYKEAQCLYYLPRYSPKLNRIEKLWKHAKSFWRRFASVNGTDLLADIQSQMKGFGSEFTVNFGASISGSLLNEV